MTFYRNYLNLELSKRKKAQQDYSLRKFAKDLEMPASTLNGILKGTSKLSPQKCSQIAKKLKLNRDETFSLIFSALSEKKVMRGLIGDDEVERISKTFLS